MGGNPPIAVDLWRSFVTMSAWRRRALVSAAWQNVHREAGRIAAEQGIEQGEAVAAVFQDPELLARCHRVGGVQVPDMPVSPVAAQNKPPQV